MSLSVRPYSHHLFSNAEIPFRQAAVYSYDRHLLHTQSEPKTISRLETESFASVRKKSSARIKVFFFLISLFSMFIGGLIYLLWRPPTLLMFSWCKSVGIFEFIQQMRSTLCFIKDYLPAWFVYSLPQALWCFSGLCCIHAIWINKTQTHECFWLAITLALPILTEIMQLFHVISGTYDIVDLVFVLIFFFVFKLLTTNSIRQEELE